MRFFRFLLLNIVALLFATSNLSAQDGGMWIPSLVKQLNIDDMQDMGLKLTADDLYSINNSSIKDAIVHFGGGCTAEMISNQGLMLTNHHCGYGKIQAHSTLENNYLKDGFWAMNKNEELSNPGLTATFIIKIEDVTNEILLGVNPEMTEVDRGTQISKNIVILNSIIKIEKYQNLKVKPFFNGNQYFAIITETYKDVRLVGAPPSMIGKFGSDTDNWIWPRHTGDFSLFRIYASTENRPAEYSEENIPYKPKHFLPISLDGVQEGDFTMVYGFPGRTQEYLPSVAIKQIKDVINPARIEIRIKALKIVDKEMRADEEINIQYASKYAGIANYWKKWIGENKGLEVSGAISKREKYEVELMENINSNPISKAKYGNLLSDFDKYYSEFEKYNLAHNYYSEIVYRNVEILKVSSVLYRLVNKYEEAGDKADEYFTTMKPEIDNYLKGFYKNYNSDVDKKVFTTLIQEYVEGIDKSFLPEYLVEEIDDYNNNYTKLSDKVFAKSALVNDTDMFMLLSKSPSSAIAKIKKDPAYKIGVSMIKAYNEKVKPKYSEINAEIKKLQRIYMAAQIEMMPNKKFYPDANSTLRITWGKVDGYEPKDGVYYYPKTYLDGIMEKYIPGDYEFHVPEKLRKIYEEKDFGIYAENGKIPVGFIGTNHTTGGNSGSPALDAHGNLIGLNFDRVWEGTMSDYNYDAKICRNIMVDVKYILFIIDKYGDAKYLLDEMKLVRPKTTLIVD
ncbi:S46 family peptidase [Flavicella sp.]|uniref:S46 family peptidase n=1 Tax=Flavicella sp. TaxID=2957742 RepID=UPI00301B3885